MADSKKAAAEVARKTFELENSIENLSPSDRLYAYDPAEQKALLKERPWKKDPKYFKKVKISAIALIRMAIHARSGGSIEVMGVMTGKILDDTFVVMDAYPLPVEGTETRVNAQAEGYEYMVEYLSSLQAVGRAENIVGWYHSHPGYGCWLSGIDVNTQHQNQSFQDPYLAIVVDPNRTIATGKVDIGAFRTYPENYTPPDAPTDEYQTIPLAKMEDFGVHASRYYPLEVSYFKSSLDDVLLELLWNKYWASTLSQSPLITNFNYTTEQIRDLKVKVDNLKSSCVHTKLADSAFLQGIGPPYSEEATGANNVKPNKKLDDINKVVTDAVKIGSEQVNGLVTREVNDRLFAKV